MNAVQTAAVVPVAPARVPAMAVLRLLLLTEAALALVIAIFLSSLADEVRAAEVSLRFAAAGAFLFAVFSAIAARGARRRRSWSWTLAALLQVLAAIGTGLAIMTAEWQTLYLAGFALAAAVMLVLSAGSVRRALNQV